MEKVLVFDVWSEYAHFRKFFTTTSPLTFSIPPRTALCGLMGAILGYPKGTYLSKFPRQHASFAVKLLNPVKKVRFSENLIDTESIKTMNVIKQHTRIKFEFLKDAKFRIYFTHTDPSVYSPALEMLQEHRCVYTPCLGISEHIANFGFIGEFSLEKKGSINTVSIDSAIRNDQIVEVQFEPGKEYMTETLPNVISKTVIDQRGVSGKEYMTETLPNVMAEDRTVTEYQQFMFERNCKPIVAKVNHYYEFENGDRILFM